jgi:hypothetical protein
LRDAVRENFAEITWFLNAFLMPTLQSIDPLVHEAIVLSGVPLSSTILPWIITWFTHCLHDEDVSNRLVDAFLAAHPLLPFYMSIALLVHPRLRLDIVTAELDDPSSMHFAIQNLPSRIKSDWSVIINNHEPDGDGFVTAQEVIETALSIMYVSNLYWSCCWFCCFCLSSLHTQLHRFYFNSLGNICHPDRSWICWIHHRIHPEEKSYKEPQRSPC